MFVNFVAVALIEIDFTDLTSYIYIYLCFQTIYRQGLSTQHNGYRHLESTRNTLYPTYNEKEGKKMVHPNTTCCKTSADGTCACAAQAKCTCGKENALHCTCNRAAVENQVSGARCSCRMSSSFPLLFILLDVVHGWAKLTKYSAGSRPVGQCTCERSTSENHPVTGEACPCGARPEASCTCEKADAVESAIETDFTTR